jgi:hypothetical protein
VGNWYYAAVVLHCLCCARTPGNNFYLGDNGMKIAGDVLDHKPYAIKTGNGITSPEMVRKSGRNGFSSRFSSRFSCWWYPGWIIDGVQVVCSMERSGMGC